MGDKSPSKRWSTTTSSALEDAVGTVAGEVDRKAMIEGLAQRKMNATKTSISFGHEKVCFLIFLG